MKHQSAAKEIAFGGVTAALSVIIMMLGGLIPAATFVCPVLCMILLQFVCSLCDRRISWAWYGAVATLSMLFGPDKEASFIFASMGFYPIVRPWLEHVKFRKIMKCLLFNGVTILLYGLLIYVLGMDQIARDYQKMGVFLTVFSMILGNLTFFLLDQILGQIAEKI